MEEEYLLNKMIKGKTEKEREIYQIKANQSKLDYLIKLAKKKGVILSRDKEVKIRMILQKKLVG